MKLRSLALSLLIGLTVSACSKPDSSNESRTTAPLASKFQDKIARDASLTIEAENVRDVATRIGTEAQIFGGTVDHSSITNSDEQYADMTVRIPADTLNAFIKELHGLGFAIPTEEVTAQDVTGSYDQEQIKLATKKATLSRLKLLENRPKTVGEEIDLQKQLAEQQAEIDAGESGSTSVASTVRFSRVTIWIRQPKPGFFGGITLGLSRGFTSISDVLQTVITIAIAGIPAFLLLFLIILVFRKLLRRFDKGSRATDLKS
jgi:hypothetical protein